MQVPKIVLIFYALLSLLCYFLILNWCLLNLQHFQIDFAKLLGKLIHYKNFIQGQKLMMMGTADEIVKAPEKGPVFVEDLPEEEQVVAVVSSYFYFFLQVGP